ncbi:unnamed protein product, partial [Ceratitis capitata]
MKLRNEACVYDEGVGLRHPKVVNTGGSNSKVDNNAKCDIAKWAKFEAFPLL